MNMQILLPFEANPPIRGYSNTAFPLSILFGKDRNCSPWFYSNFIQVVFKNDCEEFEFYTNSWWYTRDSIFKYYYIVLPKSNIKGADTFIAETIQYMLSLGFYVVGRLNEYYVPERKSYKNFNYDHDFLIYGLNTENTVYKIAGYSNTGKYITSEITIDEFINALNTSNQPDFIIHFFINNPDCEFEFDMNKVKMFLSDYLSSNDSTKIYSKEDYLGINA
jgi:hypothetical protein